MPRRAHRVTSTDEGIAKTMDRARKFAAVDRRAVRAEYDKTADMVSLHLDDGVRVSIPRMRLQGLQQATTAQLSKIQLLGGGTGLRWPRLDVDHYIPGLLNHIFGTTRWMAQLGRIGGSVTSKAKAVAARANGHKGGRPKRPLAATQSTEQKHAYAARKIG
jgi:Protein of unknown function (DUF2442)